MANYCSDYFFSFGLVNAVMRKYTKHWIPMERFGDNPDTLCTPIMKDAVMKILERRDVELFFLFSNEFASKRMTIETFMEVGEAMKTDFTTDPFNAKEFIWFCIVLAFYAAVASRRGIGNAPFQATTLLMYSLEHYRTTGEFSDETWFDLEQAAISIAQDP